MMLRVEYLLLEKKSNKSAPVEIYMALAKYFTHLLIPPI